VRETRYPGKVRVSYTNEGNQGTPERLESHTLVRETRYTGKLRVSYTNDNCIKVVIVKANKGNTFQINFREHQRSNKDGQCSSTGNIGHHR
jgi:hypothetical protein